MFNIYDAKFQKSLKVQNTHSANAIVPLVMRLVSPKSVIDIGCGTGVWLDVFQKQGNVSNIIGVDGDYIKDDLLLIEPEKFLKHDFEKSPFKTDQYYDLAISIEVAEHLSVKCADGFVESLTCLAPVVLFSAAIPYQGGTGHINEQWQDWWAKKFADQNFIPVDCMRPLLWNRNDVDFYYAQNMIIYVKKDLIDNYPALSKYADKDEMSVPLPLVHPKLWMNESKMKRKILDALYNSKCTGKITRFLFRYLLGIEYK